MARYPSGQPIILNTTLTNVQTGILTDDSTLSLTVQNPDLTTQVFTSATIVHVSTGTYYQILPASDLTQNGHYIYVWTSTSTAAGVSRGEFDVFNPFEAVVLPLQDAKQAVNIPTSTTQYDAELQSYLDTTETALETITGGPLYNTTITERVPVNQVYRALVLRQRPVVSVTSITEIASGSIMNLTDLDVDNDHGIIRRRRQWPFPYWGPYYSIVYVAGWGTTLPPAFNTAARLIVKHLWDTQNGPGMAPIPGVDQTFLPGMGYAIPQAALEVMRPFMLEAFV